MKDTSAIFWNKKALAATADLGATEMSEREVKELLAELAHDLES